MTELAFCKQFLGALDARAPKFASDYIADARNHPAQPARQYTLPRLAHPPHPQRPKPAGSAAAGATTASAASDSAGAGASPARLSVTLKPMRGSLPAAAATTIELDDAAATSIYDLKAAYSQSCAADVPVAKIKLLYNKKPAPDAKTVAELAGSAAGAAAPVEFGVMIMGGSARAWTGAGPETPTADAPAEQDLEQAARRVEVAKILASDRFWDELTGFLVQKLGGNEGEKLVDLFRGACLQKY